MLLFDKGQNSPHNYTFILTWNSWFSIQLLCKTKVWLQSIWDQKRPEYEAQRNPIRLNDTLKEFNQKLIAKDEQKVDKNCVIN